MEDARNYLDSQIEGPSLQRLITWISESALLLTACYLVRYIVKVDQYPVLSQWLPSLHSSMPHILSGAVFVAFDARIHRYLRA